MTSERDDGRVLLLSSGISLVLVVGLAAAYVASDSKLVFAQAADSLGDALTGLGLWWAIAVSRRPPDEGHVYGHHGAQPIAALIVAMFVGVLAFEVFSDAVLALTQGSSVRLHWSVFAIITLKVAIKVALVHRVSSDDSALRAFRVDALSDVLVGLASLAGFAGATVAGVPALDAWLALPVAVWIAFSGLRLGRDSIGLLMGAAPDRQWQRALLAEVAAMPDVAAIAGLKARAFGQRTHVWLEIRVDPALRVAEAHDIGERVEARLRQRPEIADAVVHVDAAVTA